MSFSQTAESWNKKGIYLSLGKSRLTVFYRSIGNIYAKPDETLLILHGFPESSYSFAKTLTHFESRFKRIVLFDFLGFGLSDKPKSGFNYSILAHADTAEMLWRAVSVQGGHLVCHDMATSVGTELLYRQELGVLKCFKAFKSITFTNGSMAIDFTKLRIAQKILLNKTTGPYFSVLVNKVIFNHQIKSAHGNDRLSREDIDDMWSYMAHNGGKKISHLIIQYYRDRMKYEKTRWLPCLQHAKIPIHLCWGADDQVAPLDMVNYLSESICPQAKLTILDGAGHFPHIGSPDTWSQKVLSFYSELTTESKNT